MLCRLQIPFRDHGEFDLLVYLILLYYQIPFLFFVGIIVKSLNKLENDALYCDGEEFEVFTHYIFVIYRINPSSTNEPH